MGVAVEGAVDEVDRGVGVDVGWDLAALLARLDQPMSRPRSSWVLDGAVCRGDDPVVTQARGSIAYLKSAHVREISARDHLPRPAARLHPGINSGINLSESEPTSEDLKPRQDG